MRFCHRDLLLRRAGSAARTALTSADARAAKLPGQRGKSTSLLERTGIPGNKVFSLVKVNAGVRWFKGWERRSTDQLVGAYTPGAFEPPARLGLKKGDGASRCLIC